MASIKDVAKKAGVSISTVSLALNYPERVSEDSKQKIFAAMKELQFVPSSASKKLQSVSGKRNSVALITGEVFGPFHYEIIRGINEMLEINKQEMILLSGADAHRRHLNDISKNPYICGAILLGTLTAPCEDIIDAASRFAVVLSNCKSNMPNVGSVSIDNYYIGELVANHLLHIGYRKIAVMGSDDDDRQLRMDGFTQTLKNNGVTIAEEWTIPAFADEKTGFTEMDRFLESGIELPQAIFCMNDELALGALDALKKHNIQTPQQVAIIGCDGISISRFSSPSLSTVLMPKFEVGMLSASLLMRQISGKPAENIVLSGKLVIRESCGYKSKQRKGFKLPADKQNQPT